MEPSTSAPAAAQLLLLSWSCLQNQALSNPEFPNKDADPVVSAVSPGSGARSGAPQILESHVFPANPAVKMTGFPGCVCWPSHKEAGQLIRPEHFLHLIGPAPTDSSAGLTFFCFIAACINCFKCVGQST